jgi:hypothetical protein
VIHKSPSLSLFPARGERNFYFTLHIINNVIPVILLVRKFQGVLFQRTLESSTQPFHSGESRNPVKSIHCQSAITIVQLPDVNGLSGHPVSGTGQAPDNDVGGEHDIDYR